MRLAPVALVALVLLASAATARADAPPPMWSVAPGMAEPYAPPPPPVTREVSYARQTLIADGIAAALMTAAVFQSEEDTAALLLFAGLDTYALGAPIVHFANREIGNGLKSFALRMGLPVLGALAGARIGPKDAFDCDVAASCAGAGVSLLGIAVGVGAGMITAAAIDSRYLARKRVVVEAPRFSPTIGHARGGLTLGLGGSF